MIRQCIAIYMLVLLMASHAAAMNESEKIEALLISIECSDLIFIRNGIEYSSREARKHLGIKLSKAGMGIRTARQFIDHIATRSTWTGQPYLVKFPDGSVMKTADWLRRRLAEMEKAR